jgi:lipid-binding SYLF domain-containing protein
LGDNAKGVLVFPDNLKGGFVVAGQYGDGALRKNGKIGGYYRSLAASVGFQVGGETYENEIVFSGRNRRMMSR